VIIQNTTRPLVSIVVPCYNAERTIDSCLGSLYSQRFLGLEIICVDDGSTDCTADILREMQLTHPELVVVRQQNSGAWIARLTGIRIAKGDYIMFLDSDDAAVPGFIDKMYTAISNAGSDLVVCGFNRVDADSGALMSSEFCEPLEPFVFNDDPGKILQVNPAPWNKIYRASLLGSVNELSVAPVMFDDLCLLLIALLHSDVCISYLPEALVEYKVHEDSTINSMNALQLEDAVRAMIEIRSQYADSSRIEILEAFDSVAFAHIGVSMSFRILGSNSENTSNVIDSLIAVLDREFPLWRSSRYLRMSYGLENGGIFIKAAIASAFVKFGLFKPALVAYRFAKKAIGKDISW